MAGQDEASFNYLRFTMINDQIQALYAALKAMKPNQMTDAQFALFVLLEGWLDA